MRVLAINCGSSTLKFQLFELERDDKGFGPKMRLARGLVEEIGIRRGGLDFTIEGGESLRKAVTIADHGQAMRRVLAWLQSSGFREHDVPLAVGHRVVHGGSRFTEAVVIEEQVLAAIEAVSELAPLHNEPALGAIYAAKEEFGPKVSMVAVFDTAFHSTLPERASNYAIAPDLAAKHEIRRYGFHGIAHRYMTERYSVITPEPIEQAKLITLQLGNGCSVTAVSGGRSIDTSMGFTPLEGLVMGTRSGDLDPSLPGFLARREGVDVEEVEDWLNKKSGLLGVSGRSRDMRDLLQAAHRGDRRAELAVEMFCYRVRKYIGAYLAVLRGADAIVFGGGIGENAPAVRARICMGMDWCGLRLDEDRNAKAVGSEERISSDDAKVHAYVIPVDEEVTIARETLRCLDLRRR
ncbi:MAG: acetate/propionate family kinase [Proteobacteria bacterium]|nr:acetate/propionate family kinase [Pseudomonadota bacterium]